MSDKFNGISYSWTQSYSMNPFYQDLQTLHELQRLDDIDRAVENMTSYPDVELIMKKIAENSNEA